MTTDGDRVALQFDPGPESIASVAEMDISMARAQLVFHSGSDSVTFAMILPPDLAAMTGGDVGFRIDAAIPDSGFARSVNYDSLLQASRDDPENTAVNTGTVSTVAGIDCEEWLIGLPQVVDSVANPFSPIRMCVAEEDGASRAVNDVWHRLMARFGVSEQFLRAGARTWFGDREMVAIRTVVGDDENFVLELESSEAGTNPAYFTVPDGLTPFPADMLTGMIQAQMQQQGTPEQ